jgi:hypothetical protein
LEELLALLEGCPPPELDNVHELTEEGVTAAFERLKSRRARGKVLFQINAEQMTSAGVTVCTPFYHTAPHDAEQPGGVAGNKGKARYKCRSSLFHRRSYIQSHTTMRASTHL